jgi:hypothetical protein
MSSIIFQVVPSVANSFTTYEMMKALLGVPPQERIKQCLPPCVRTQISEHNSSLWNCRSFKSRDENYCTYPGQLDHYVTCGL